MKKAGFIPSRLGAIRIAFEGLGFLVRTQPNVKVYLVFSLAVIIAGGIFGITRMEWITLAITVGLVWGAETFNTALEELVDLVHPEQHSQVKVIKDLSAGAVLISAMLSVVVGLLIFGPRLWAWIAGFF